jgi:hypothetical protein
VSSHWRLVVVVVVVVVVVAVVVVVVVVVVVAIPSPFSLPGDYPVRMMYAKIQLMLQLLFNAAYAKFGIIESLFLSFPRTICSIPFSRAGDPEGTLHATTGVLIEFLCYCIETPAFIGVKVSNGKRFEVMLLSYFSIL